MTLPEPLQASPDPNPATRFSVLIPLEFTRGIAERCVRAWTAGMAYPRERYELLIAAPADYDPAEITLLGSMLGPQDRIVTVAAEHDIALVAEGAQRVDGEILIFTEAHCIPEPDFLVVCDRAFAENPGWDGFSGGSKPLTHNLLSRVEADMYVADIERNLREHPWLKVLDQCFVIKRSAYERSGGLETRYGHFAEHLLAARLHRAGTEIGYDPRAAIGHHYVGETGELIEFARDYGRGQLLFASAAANDACGDMFESPAEWRGRLAAEPAVARRMVRMLIADTGAARREPAGVEGESVPRKRLQGRGLGRWIAAALTRPALRVRISRARVQLCRLRLVALLLVRAERRARTAFLALNDTAAALGGTEALGELRRTRPGEAGLSGNPHVSEWTAATADLIPSVGFHDLERVDRRPFRWSEPAAMISIDRVSPGDTIEIHWSELEGQGHAGARFYLNERRLPAVRISHGRRSTTIRIDRSCSPARLGWVVGRASGPGDSRDLGLPVSTITWRTPVATPTVTGTSASGPRIDSFRRPGSAAVEGADPIYLLHVQKCAGTSLRATIGNAFRADERLSRTLSLYYARQLDETPRDRLESCSLAIGHFGWELPTLMPDHPWRVMTVLREPRDRLASQYAYLHQQSYIPASLTLARWVEEELRVRDLMIGHLTPRSLGSAERGIAETGPAALERERSAVEAIEACSVVGTFERMEDSVNILCAATGALPPSQSPHLNPTLSRAEAKSATAALSPAAERVLEAEARVHRRAAEICDEHVRALHARLLEPGEGEIDSATARERLRLRWFRDQAARIPGDEFGEPFGWLPDDPLPGENLHPLEEHGGLMLRWTGGEERTLIHVPIDTGRRWRLRLALHPATPGDHIAATGVRINGRELELAVGGAGNLAPLNGGGSVLGATVEAPPSDPGTAPFSALELFSPVRRGEGEFRRLGLALCAILLEPLA